MQRRPLLVGAIGGLRLVLQVQAVPFSRAVRAPATAPGECAAELGFRRLLAPDVPVAVTDAPTVEGLDGEEDIGDLEGWLRAPRLDLILERPEIRAFLLEL